jgi:N-acetyl-D-muramate 6-phosphate phosphatase
VSSPLTVSGSRVAGVLFDLDGTLLDTAPDMGGALNELRIEQGLEPLPPAMIRGHVSRGALALVRLGFPGLSETERALRVERFLTLYRNRVSLETRPFPEVPAVLERLEAVGMPWGIVTNKPTWLTEPLLLALRLSHRARVVVCGDTLPERKPSPLPLLHAAARMEVTPDRCIYVGDDLRDMQAARAAGMPGICARFGYIDSTEKPDEWPADGWIDSPLQVLELLARRGA